jgi:hypothetical protein
MGPGSIRDGRHMQRLDRLSVDELRTFQALVAKIEAVEKVKGKIDFTPHWPRKGRRLAGNTPQKL